MNSPQPHGAGEDDVARLEREAAGAEGEQLGDAEDHLRGRGVLHHLAVHPCPQRQRLRVENLVGCDDDRSEWAEAVEAFARTHWLSENWTSRAETSFPTA